MVDGCRAVYPKGVGAPGLARYLQEANKEVEVWLQVGQGHTQHRNTDRVGCVRMGQCVSQSRISGVMTKPCSQLCLVPG